ncbi:MAG: hypothetical protein ABI460_10085 [Caldimonas sp.]
MAASSPAFAADAIAAATSGQAASSAGTPLISERQRIASERAAALARYASRERECKTRFIVTSCIDDAKSERREALDKLRARQLGADEVRRRERAAERQSELAEKAAEDARLESARAARGAAAAASGVASQGSRMRIPSPRRPAAPERAVRGASAPAPRLHAPEKALGVSPVPRESAAVRHEREERSRAAFQARQDKAAEHREDSTTATVRRMASKSPAAALPAPSTASATMPR